MNHFKILVLILLAIYSSALLGSDLDGKKSKWKGFDRYDFQVDNKAARVVLPNQHAPGKPWLWRARFPDWHTEADSILLSRGYMVAYINTDNLYGSPSSVEIWNNFYSYLTEECAYNPKVALAGVSRGGLFVYNWAKQNPDKVACIYAEAPVCDFTSWPGGFGEGKGSPKDWEQLKTAYGFKTDEEAKVYSGNPIDNLEKLAGNKIPVLHTVGLNDKIVPVEENTFSLVNRYLKLGGIATVVPCTSGEHRLEGHHFNIDNPVLVADFIQYHSKEVFNKLNSEDYHKIRGGIRNCFIKFKNEKKGRVAFLGGSITYNGGWRDSICNYLTTRFPDTDFEFIAAGIPSMGTTPAAFRLKRDVLKNGPVDLLFEEAAVNDASNGRSKTEQLSAMEGIIRGVRNQNPACDVVLMHFVDPDKMTTYRKNKVPEVIANHEQVAKYYNVASINLAKEVTNRIDAGEFTWEDDFKNLHPSPFGQDIYFQSMKAFMENAWYGFVAEDDKVTSYEMPDKMTASCYDNGELIPANSIQTDKGWNVIGKWKPEDGKGTRHNYVNVPMLVNEGVGKQLKYKFKGNTVGIAVAAGPDAGIIEYRIDNGEWQKLDLFTNWSSNLHLPWYYTLAADLENKPHILRLRLTDDRNDQSSGSTCRIRYFYVNRL